MSWVRVSSSDKGESCWPATRSSTAACLVDGNDWYHFGGMGDYRHDDLWCFQLTTQTWRLVHPGTTSLSVCPPDSMPTASNSKCPPKRCKASLVHHKGKLYVFGGWCLGKGNAKLGDMWSFDLASSTWKEIKQQGVPPANRSAHSATVVGDTMFLFGGIGANKFGETFTFSFKTHTWQMLCGKGALPPRSSYGSLLLLDGDDIPPKLLLFGGLTCGQLNDVICFDTAAAGAANHKGWQVVPATAGTPPFKRGRHASALVPAGPVLPEPTIFVFGGTNLRTRDNSLFSFGVHSGEWKRIVAAKPPPPMEGASMCASPDGTLLYVFGGLSKSGWPRDVFVFDLGQLASASPKAVASEETQGDSPPAMFMEVVGDDCELSEAGRQLTETEDGASTVCEEDIDEADE